MGDRDQDSVEEACEVEMVLVTGRWNGTSRIEVPWAEDFPSACGAAEDAVLAGRADWAEVVGGKRKKRLHVVRGP
jgi:hypothetical protein